MKKPISFVQSASSARGGSSKPQFTGYGISHVVWFGDERFEFHSLYLKKSNLAKHALVPNIPEYTVSACFSGPLRGTTAQVPDGKKRGGEQVSEFNHVKCLVVR